MAILGTSDVVADMNTLGTSDIVTDMNLLGTSANVTNMATLGASGVVGNVATVAGVSGNVTTVAGISSDVTAVAGKATEIGRLGTADAVADMAILGTADVVADLNTLGTADVVADLNTLGTADVVSDLNTLGTADVVADMNTLGTGANVTNMATLGASGVVGNIATVAGISSDVTAVAGKATEIGRLGTADAVADMNTLGTADVVADMNTLGTADVVADLNTLGTADVVADMNTLGTADNVTNMNTVADNITNVNRYADEYTIAASEPGSPSEGDLWYDSSNNILKVHNGSSFVAVTTADAHLPLSGGTMTGAIDFGDNVKANFGASDDLQIYHDGHSYIKENGTGQLFIEGTNLRLRTSAGVNYFLADENGRTGMFYSGSEKLSTTNTGVDISGTVTADKLVSADGILELDDNGTHNGIINSPASLYVNLDSDANSSGEDFIIAKDRTSTTGGTELFRVQEDGNVGIGVTPESGWQSNWSVLQFGDAGVLSGRNDSNGIDFGTNFYYDSVSTRWEYITNDEASYYNQSNGNHAFRRAVSGTADNQITWQESLTLSNNGDISFYESTGTTPKLFWDASVSSLGIGTSSPTYPLHVKSSASATANFDAGSDGYDVQLRFEQNGTFVGAVGFDDSEDVVFLNRYGNGTQGLTVDSSGDVTIPNATGASFVLSREDTSNSTGDLIGAIGFRNTDASGSAPNYCGIKAKVSGGAGSDGELEFYTGRTTYEADSGAVVIIRDTGNVDITGGDLDVTGSVTADGLTSDGATNYPIKWTGAGGAATGSLYGDGSSVGLFYGDSSFATGLNFTTDTLKFRTGSSERLRIDSSGDISFYEDTGTTAKFFWDASAEKLGIGMTPAEVLDLKAASGDTRIRLDAATGSDTEIKFYNNGVSQYTIGHDDGTDNFVIGSINVDAPLVSVDKSGNVDITGTVTADDYIAIDNSSSYTYIIGTRTGASDGDSVHRTFGYDGSAFMGSFDIRRKDSNSGSLVLRQKINGNNSDVMVVEDGNVGIGVTPEAWHSEWNVLQMGDSVALSARTNGDTLMLTNNAYYDSVSGRWEYIGANGSSEATYYVQNPDGKHVFYVAPSGAADAAISWTAAMTIDNNGQALFNTANTSTTVGGVALRNSNDVGTISVGHATGTASGNTYMAYKYGGTSIGSITQNGTTGTAYNTSSDYRLKENVDYTWDATTRLKQLKPARFNFIADDTNTLVDGFIAHEVSDIVPEAISGEKDAMMDEEYEVTPAVKDEDGNIVTEAVMGTRSVPDHQGIDQSKLVPLLVKTIQELEARITTLENA
jgi:hypothetical protein